MAMHRDRIIAAVNHPAEQGLFEAFPHMASSNGHIKGAGVAIKVGIAGGHFGEGMEILGVEESAFCAAVGCDDSNTALEREGEDLWVGELGRNDRHGMFAAGMGEQWQFCLGHTFPELRKASIIAVDILAIGKAFHHDCAPGDAAVEFFDGIRTGGMDRNGWKEFGMLARELEDVIVRDKERACAIDRTTLVIVDQVLSQDDRGAEGRSAQLFEESIDVKAIEVAGKCAGRQADVTKHDTGQRSMPTGDSQPATGVAGAVTHDVHVHVNGLRGIWNRHLKQK